MRSTSAGHRRQSGQSLVEALIASMVVGIAVVAGLETLNATVVGARQVAIQGWAECVQRGEVEAVVAAEWNPTGGYPAPPGVTVQVSSPPAAGTGAQAVQRITVTVADPRTGVPIARVQPVSLYKAAVVSPRSAPAYDVNAIATGCRGLLGGGP